MGTHGGSPINKASLEACSRESRHFSDERFNLHNSYQANAAVKVKPDFDCPINNYHQNVVIENNHFFGNNPRLLDAMCVDGLVFQNNTYRAPLVDETGMEVYRIRVANCKNTDIQEVD